MMQAGLAEEAWAANQLEGEAKGAGSRELGEGWAEVGEQVAMVQEGVMVGREGVWEDQVAGKGR